MGSHNRLAFSDRPPDGEPPASSLGQPLKCGAQFMAAALYVCGCRAILAAKLIQAHLVSYRSGPVNGLIGGQRAYEICARRQRQRARPPDRLGCRLRGGGGVAEAYPPPCDLSCARSARVRNTFRLRATIISKLGPRIRVVPFAAN